MPSFLRLPVSTSENDLSSQSQPEASDDKYASHYGSETDSNNGVLSPLGEEQEVLLYDSRASHSRLTSDAWSRTDKLLASTLVTLLLGAIAGLIYLLSANAAAQLSTPGAIPHSPSVIPVDATYIMKQPCGSTPEEARARGCNFDVISFSWFPNECYDRELDMNFRTNTLEWFLYPNKTGAFTWEQILTGEHTDLYVNWEYHIKHCTAMWQKLHRALLGRGVSAIDSYIGTLAHTHHCSQMLLEHHELQELNTIIRVKYPDCGYEGKF